jgi:hypothetical protein
MDIKAVLNGIWAKQLVWFAHLQRMDEEGLLRKIDGDWED